jgi:phosphatidylserine/phosphatidylglycerophosphate/cardiolipin synthase-like enzyme
MVIDGETVLTGSFNFTKAAQEKNAENLQIIRDPALAAQYTQNWDAHRQYSQPYVGRGVR